MFVKLRADTPDRSPRAPSRRRGDPHRPDEVPGPPLRPGRSSGSHPRERARAAPRASVQVLHRAAARRARVAFSARSPCGSCGRPRRSTRLHDAPRSGSPTGPRWRSTTPACTSSRPTSPRFSSTACCRARCPRSRASRPPRASWPPARRTRSAATSTTSSAAARGSWTAVIGDVCGKGPEAASLTALARYTVRTASLPRQLAEQVLRTLHDSISSERADLRFCTAALARIQAPSNGPRARAPHRCPRRPSRSRSILRKDGRVRVDRRARDAARRASPPPSLADVEADPRGRRLADPLHGRGARRPRSRPSATTRTGWPRSCPGPPGRAPSRSPSGSPRPRSSATAASPATTSRSSSCIATAPASWRPFTSAARAGSIRTGASVFYPKGVPQREWLELLRRALRHRRDQQHLLPAALAVRRSRAGSSRARGIPLRGQGEPLPDPHQAPHMVEQGMKRFYEPLDAPDRHRKARPAALAVPAELPPRHERLADALGCAAAGPARLRVPARELVHDEVYSLAPRPRRRAGDRRRVIPVGEHAARPDRRLDLHSLPPRQPRPARQLLRRRRSTTWARRIAQWRRDTEVYAYFNNDWEGYAIRNARLLKSRLGL